MGNPAGRRVSRDTAMDGRSRRAYGARPVVRACRAKARHRGVGAIAFWLLCRFCKVTRRKAGTLSGRCRSNGYVLKSRAPSPRLSRRRRNQLGDAEDTRLSCLLRDSAASKTGRPLLQNELSTIQRLACRLRRSSSRFFWMSCNCSRLSPLAARMHWGMVLAFSCSALPCSVKRR